MAGPAAVGIPDSVRRDIADGRYRKASLGLRAYLQPLESAPLGARLVLAEAEAGWKNWNGAISALTTGGLDTAQAPARIWYLLGTSRQAAGDRDGAAADLRRFLDTSPTGSRETLAARARLAGLLAETGSPDGAIRMVEELRDHSPVMAGWTALAVAESESIRCTVDSASSKGRTISRSISCGDDER